MPITRFTETDHTRLWEHLNRVATETEAIVAPLIVNSGWTALTTINGWAGNPQACRIGNTVHLVGRIVASTNINAQIATLPESLRPPGDRFVTVQAPSGITLTIVCGTTGALNVWTSSGTVPSGASIPLSGSFLI